MIFDKFKRRKYIENYNFGPQKSVTHFKKSSNIKGFQTLKFSKKIH